MAKSKGADLAKKFLSISGKVNKDITNYGSTLSSSIFSNIDEYIDTGSYSLNRLITGDIYKGIPRGRVIALAGECVSGNTIVTVRLDGEVKNITIKELVEKNL